MKVKTNLLKYKDPTTGEYISIPVVASGSGDANVTITTESITNALGYTPAKQGDVESLVEEINGLPVSNVAYGTCETDAATAEKVVTISNNENWTLGVGSVVMVYFTTSNSASSVKLNVNGTGAYPIWYNNAEYTSTGTQYCGYAKRVINYMFNGTHWVWVGSSYDANSTYKNVTLGQGYATCSTAEATTAKVGTLSGYTLTLGGIVAVKFTYGVPASATLNINSKGAKKIFYRGSDITSGIIKAGDVATFIYDGTQYQLLSIDRWQNDITQLSEEIVDHKNDTTHITNAERIAWNNKSNFSGNYNDLTNKPTIPSVDGLASETYVDNEINEVKANMNQLQPLFMESMEELEANGDVTKLYILPDNFIYAYQEVADVPSGPSYTNLAEPLPNNTTDTTKWVNGYRYSSSGITAMDGTTLSNYISCKNGDIIRIKGVELWENSNRIAVLWTETEGVLGYFNVGITNTSASATYLGLKDGVYSFQVADGTQTVKGFRFAMPTPTDASQIIITVNEEIKEGSGGSSSGYTNLFDKTKDGFKEGYRFNSSGVETAESNAIITNYIPIELGKKLHIKGITTSVNGGSTYCRMVTHKEDYTQIAECCQLPTNAPTVFVTSDYDASVAVWTKIGYYTETSIYSNFQESKNAKYLRIGGYLAGSVDDVVITIDEDIVESDEPIEPSVRKAWTNTGHAFIPTEYDSQIASLTTKVNANAISVNALVNTTNNQSQDIESLKTSVEDLESGKTTTSLPDYWEEYLPSKIATIKALQEVGGKDCFSFPLLTDIHISINLGKRSGLLAKRIMDECCMKYAVCCGDVVTRAANKTKAQMEQHYADAEELLAPIRSQLLQTQGNHDGSYGAEDLDGDGDVEGEEYYCFNYTPQQNYERIYRKVGLVGDVHFDKSGSGYWIDDVSNKVRYIGMNSHCNKYEENTDGTAIYNNMRVFRLTQSQFDMTIEALTTIPSNEWAVVSFSHAPLNNRDGNLFADRIVMRDMLNAYKNKTSYKGTYGTSENYDYVTVNVDFTNAKGQYIAHFSGHTHTDSLTTDFGIPIITTRCDGNEENDTTLNAEKVLGTVTEQSFDIFTVNKAEGKIYATKIGAGSDRVINYELMKDETTTYTNALPTAFGINGKVLNGVGYVDGYYLTGNPTIGTIDIAYSSYMSVDDTHFTTGYIPYTKAQAVAQTPIYIKGVTIDVAQSHTRLGVFPSLEYDIYIEQMKASSWSSYLTLETLDTGYYKLTPNSSFSTYFSGNLQPQNPFDDYSYIRFSLQGSGKGVVISVGKEITD